MKRENLKFKMAKKKKIRRAAAVEAEAEAAASPPWIELPSDVTGNILGRLGTVEILQSAQRVCATWHRVCQNPALWRVINIVSHEYEYDENKYIMMCHSAVDRSNGQLMDLTLENFHDYQLLAYISDRSSLLRRLTISRFCISRAGLSEAVKKLPELEELHLFSIFDIRPNDDYDVDVDVEAIGIACPKLESFTFNRTKCKHQPQGYGFTHADFAYGGDYDDDDVSAPLANNEHAVAIAKFMPNLCHLSLFANDMDNHGLQAILDGCPRLESLDLRQCFGVDLGGALGIRCRQQIKDLRAPSDSVIDYHHFCNPYIMSESDDSNAGYDPAVEYI